MTSQADRVRELIAASGLTQQEFGTRIGLDTSKLSKSLSGVRRFSSLDLARIAEVADVTVDWLITGEELAFAVAARATAGTARAASVEATRLATLRSDMTFLGHPQPWTPVTAVLIGLTEIAQGEALAAAALEAIRVAGVPFPIGDLPAAIEQVFGADVTVLPLGAGFDGLAVSSTEVKLILASTSTVPARQRFTIAHELGHLLAGDDQELTVDEDVFDANHRRTPGEMRANAFAAAFLMPESVLRRVVGTAGLDETGFARLCFDFGVSPSSLSYRLQNLRLLDAGQAHLWGGMSGARVAALIGAGAAFAGQVSAAGQPRPPGLLVATTYRVYEQGEATLRPYANLVGVDVDVLRASLETSVPGLTDRDPAESGAAAS